MLKKVLKTAAAGLVILVCLGLAVYVASGPVRPDSESASAAWLSRAYRVGRAELVFVDDTRPPEKIGDSRQTTADLADNPVVSEGAELPCR